MHRCKLSFLLLVFVLEFTFSKSFIIHTSSHGVKILPVLKSCNRNQNGSTLKHRNSYAIQKKSPFQLFQSRRSEIDSLALDETSLPVEEQDRIKKLRKEYGLSGIFNEEEEFEENITKTDEKMKNYSSLDKKPSVQIEFQEDEDIEVLDTDWSGQAGLDVVYVGDKKWSDITSRPLLYFGDMTALLLFAAIGRASHGNSFNIFAPEAIKTALPFLVTWTALSPLVGAYTLDATSITDKKKVIAALLSSWLVSVPLAIMERGLLKGEIPPIFLS